MKKISFVFTLVLFFSCDASTDTEKKQPVRNNVFNVKEAVVSIPIGGDPLVSGVASMYLLCEYLLVLDFESYDNTLHIYNKNTFEYLNSAIKKGRGPLEAVTGSFIETDEADRRFYLSDFGKLSLFEYNIDSLVNNPLSAPHLKAGMKNRLLPVSYTMINDTTCIGLVMEPIGNTDFSMTLSKINFNTDEIDPLPYVHPKVAKKRVSYAVSPTDLTFLHV